MQQEKHYGRVLKNEGVVCFFEAKMPEVCGPPLQLFVAEEVDQTAATFNKKYVCF